MSVFARLKKAREEKKGFTLVELIVVLVILAILAAILVPALLGWIDEAKKKQTVLEARNVYIATQTIADEQYAKGGDDHVLKLEEKDVKRIREIADVSSVTFKYVTVTNASAEAGDHGGFTVTGMGITIIPSTGGEATYAVLDGDTWEVYKSATDEAAPTTTPANTIDTCWNKEVKSSDVGEG